MVATPTWTVIGAFFNSVQSAPVGNRPKEEETNEQEDEDDEMADDRVPLYLQLLPFILHVLYSMLVKSISNVGIYTNV